MKELYNLKSWFSLGDAAERLSSSIREPVTVEDILQLVVEGHLALSWYTRHVPARKVAPFTHLYRKGFAKEIEGESPLANALRALVETREKDAVEGWEATDGEDAIEYLDGPYRLELDHCGALKDWIHSHLTLTGGELISLEGFFVSKPDGTIWQIMDLMPSYTVKDPIGSGQMRAYKPFYYPGGTFPDENELVIQRSDIEHFENSLREMPADDCGKLPKRSETTYLNIIAALLEIVCKGIPYRQVEHSTIGPAAGFQSEAKLIAAMADHYQGIAGFSKNTLEKKFPAAKQRLIDSST